jgi:hypothetical protein
MDLAFMTDKQLTLTCNQSMEGIRLYNENLKLYCDTYEHSFVFVKRGGEVSAEWLMDCMDNNKDWKFVVDNDINISHPNVIHVKNFSRYISHNISNANMIVEPQRPRRGRLAVKKNKRN